MEVEPGPSFLARHGVTRGVVVRLAVVIGMLLVVGARFERTIVALAISAVFLLVVALLGRAED